ADVILYGLVALAGVLLSALFSGMETGLYTINRVRLAVRAGAGEPRALRLRGLLGDPNRVLSTILIGNNIANYAGSYGIAALLDRAGFSPVEAVAVNAAVLVPLLFVFGETLPKDLFRTHTDRWSYACSGLLRWLTRLLTWTGFVPLVVGFGRVAARVLGAPEAAATTARQRVSQLIREGMGAGLISETQTTLAERSLALRRRPVSAEMVPWGQVATLPADAGRPAREAVMRAHPFTRLPIVGRDGRPVGVVSVLDLVLDPDRPTRDLARGLTTFAPATTVREAMRTLQRERRKMAVIADPRTGRPLGIVTLKDLVEPLTGELRAW
ncbi:MAG: CNNM domain-containing protein, partial [Planctomycetota bacterium]